MKASARLFASLSLCAAATTLAVTLTSRNVEAANPSANLDQCGNGPINAPVPCSGSAWINGNTNESKSHGYEGDSIAYRLLLPNLTPGRQHTVVIQCDPT